MKRFLEFIQNYDEENASTHQGFDLDKNTMNEIYTYFGLESGTKDFIGHAMALWSTDDYLNEVARPTYERILLYASSVAKYGKSPYIYPLYGLGELPQGFARLSAIYGGTYMLDTPIDEVLYEGEGENKSSLVSSPKKVKQKLQLLLQTLHISQSVLKDWCQSHQSHLYFGPPSSWC